MDFEQIEDAIINELKTNIAYLKTVETYAGQLEGSLERLPVGFPAVFVVYSGSGYSAVDGMYHEEKVEFSVLVAARDLKGGEAARKDAHGAYGIVKDVLAVLTNKTFGLDMERLRPVRTQLVFANRTVAVYGIDFRTGFDKAY
jgi:phage gp37-like protein